MPQTSELERLSERRRLLVAESAELRLEVAEGFTDLKSSAAWLERGYALVQSGRLLWPLLAGLAGLLLARQSGGWLGTARKLWSWWGLAKKLSAFWRSFQAPNPQ